MKNFILILVAFAAFVTATAKTSWPTETESWPGTDTTTNKYPNLPFWPVEVFSWPTSCSLNLPHQGAGGSPEFGGVFFLIIPYTIDINNIMRNTERTTFLRVTNKFVTRTATQKPIEPAPEYRNIQQSEQRLKPYER